MKRPRTRAALLLGTFLVAVLKTLRCTRTIDYVTCTIERVGGDQTNGGYGAWPTCVNLITDKPTIWSFGVGCDTTFELDLRNRFHEAKIISFDPTIDRERFELCMQRSLRAFGEPDTQNVVSVFSKIGLANYSGRVSFKKSNDPRIGSKSIAHGIRDTSGKEYKSDDAAANFVEVQSLKSLYTIYGLHHSSVDDYALDILKIDIEGAEFDVIPAWCSSGFHPRVKQILIEFHDRLFDEGMHKRQVVYVCLRDLGYVLVYENVPSKEEVVFIHIG